jgi:hypothetical protein
MSALHTISQPIFPSREKTLATGACAAAGFLYGNLPGLAIGGTLGYIVSTALGKAVAGVTGYIRNGTNTVYQNTKELFSAASTTAGEAIYYIATNLPLWLIDKLENAEWVQETNHSADAAYLVKCRGTTRQVEGRELSMDLRSLFTAVPEGVSSQEPVIAALAAQAIAADQGVSKDQIGQWIALGERLIAGLTSGKASEVRNGAILIESPEDGQKIYVESSVYSTRAIMWYFAAQALWGELVKQEALLCGHAHPTAADVQKMAEDCLRHETFVFPDKNGQIFTFLSKAKTRYLDKTELLCRDSGLAGADQVVRNQTPSMTLPVIDDTSRYLPGGARRTAFNALLSVEENKGQRLAVRLEELSNPSVLGQRREGHESLLWNVAQMAIAAPRQIVAAAQNLKTPSGIMPKTQSQQRQHAIHIKMLEMLRRVRSGDAAWGVNQRAAFDAVKQLPLHELVPYLVHPEHAEAYNAKLAILNELSDIERDQLKVMVYRALLEEVQAGEDAPLHRRSHETLLMPYITGKTEVLEYWHKHIALLQGKIFGATFTLIEKQAQQEENNQYFFSWIIDKFINKSSSPVKMMQERKAHEQTLFQEAYLANLNVSLPKNVQRPAVIIELDMEAEIKEIDDDRVMNEFELVEKPIIDAPIAVESVAATMMVKPAQIKGNLPSFVVQDYMGPLPTAITSASCAA